MYTKKAAGPEPFIPAERVKPLESTELPLVLLHTQTHTPCPFASITD